MQYDLLIIGRGIAGAVLAEAARLRGLSSHVFDTKQPGNATMAAGGVVNPVVLRRLTSGWRADQLMPRVHSFYRNWDARRGRQYWHEAPVVKIFSHEKEAALWRTMGGKEVAPWLSHSPQPEVDAGPFRAPFGHGTVTNAGWLDLPAALQAQRAELEAEGRFTEALVTAGHIREEGSGISVMGMRGRWLVHCTGPFPAMQGLSLVKGETITVRIPGLRLTRIVYGGTGLVPAGEGLFKAGSTFKWTDVWEGPTAQAREWLLGRLMEMLTVPVQVVASEAGVRPAALDRAPILGRTGQRQAVFNGMGARGVMQAPWCADHLLDHLFHERGLDPAVDVARFGR